jgi:hypothetical protein
LVFTAPPQWCAGTGVWIPTFCNFWGLNDRFGYGDRETMRRYFTRLTRLDEYIDLGGIFHPETFLVWSMAGVELHRTQAVFSTLRPDGTTDDPEWRRDRGDVC